MSLTCKFCYLPSEDVIHPRCQEEGDSARLRALHIVSLTFCHSTPIFCSLPFFGGDFLPTCALLLHSATFSPLPQQRRKAKTGTGPSEKQHGPSAGKECRVSVCTSEAVPKVFFLFPSNYSKYPVNQNNFLPVFSNSNVSFACCTFQKVHAKTLVKQLFVMSRRALRTHGCVSYVSDNTASQVCQSVIFKQANSNKNKQAGCKQRAKRHLLVSSVTNQIIEGCQSHNCLRLDNGYNLDH